MVSTAVFGSFVSDRSRRSAHLMQWSFWQCPRNGRTKIHPRHTQTHHSASTKRGFVRTIEPKIQNKFPGNSFDSMRKILDMVAFFAFNFHWMDTSMAFFSDCFCWWPPFPLAGPPTPVGHGYFVAFYRCQHATRFDDASLCPFPRPLLCLCLSFSVCGPLCGPNQIGRCEQNRNVRHTKINDMAAGSHPECVPQLWHKLHAQQSRQARWTLAIPGGNCIDSARNRKPFSHRG